MIECDNFNADFEELEENEMYSDNLDELLEIELAFLLYLPYYGGIL